MSERVLEKIVNAEAQIENAMWQATVDGDRKKELADYREVEALLTSLENLTLAQEQERNRVLAYCLMRIDETLLNMGDDEDSEQRAQESLRIAELSGDAVQIARSSLALGIRLLNTGQLPEAEKQWRRVFKLADGLDENNDMQQVIGWTLIVRSNVLLGKSLYNQALKVAQRAKGILLSLKNYAGLAAVNSVLARIHSSLGDMESSEMCKSLAEDYGKKAKEHKQ